MLRELKVINITRCSTDDSTYMAVLKEDCGTRMLPVLMNCSEAHQLLVRHYRSGAVEVYRSMADILLVALGQLGGSMCEVRIEAVHSGMTLCTLYYQCEETVHRVAGCRAADGLLLAAVAECPVTIEETLLEQQYMREVAEGVYSMPANSVSYTALEKALQRAVEEENYELASQLRDELRRRK